MRGVLFDADAFHCLRSLGLLGDLCAAGRAFEITEYVKKVELNPIAGFVDALVAGGALTVHPVSDPEGRARWKKLRTEGAHKGEAEALAWLLGLPAASRPVFVTRDTGATARARAHGVATTDVFGLVCAAIEVGWMDLDHARAALAVWDDKAKQICRPREWSGFDSTRAKRIAAVRAAFDL